MTANKESAMWKQTLENVYSPWHQFYIEAIHQYAPERYLDNLRATIPQQWQNGLPVIEDLLAKQEYRQSLTVIQETIDALLKSKHYAPNNLWEKVMAYWKANLHNFVPRPEMAQNSDYTHHAEWMAAVNELAPQDYKKLLQQWKVEHQRRRNLWKAMGKQFFDADFLGCYSSQKYGKFK